VSDVRKKVGVLSSVIPVEACSERSRRAGIQVGTGYFFVFQKVACPLSGIWIPGRAPLSRRLPGMTIE